MAIKNTNHTYILGTGLSHDGSACILKDGRIAVAIEKERLSRIKHDGGNDTLAVQYCLDALGIQFTDLSLVVQVSNFEKDIAPDRFRGARLHHPDVPVHTISHHLAHAYSAIATSPFKESNVLVIDGAGSPADQCEEWPDEATKAYWLSQKGFYCEKDSFYLYKDNKLQCLQKDFSECRLYHMPEGSIRMPTNYHSIGGLYAAASNYCFGNLDDAGKLMGLAPYGKDNAINGAIFLLEEGRVMVDHTQLEQLRTPAADYDAFKQQFQHYADVARWVQKEAERAVSYIAKSRMDRFPHQRLCYAGGVALNAVCNAQLLKKGIAAELYLQPAAGDNGLSIGCAYYGWNHLLEQEIPHNQSRSVCYGKSYAPAEVLDVLRAHPQKEAFTVTHTADYINVAAGLLADGKVLAWFQEGAEFGPRALGHRSILADPRRKDIQLHINQHIKFREDFRPFAPAVLKEDVAVYFEHAWESPYMILIDDIKDAWATQVPGIVHVDGTCRVQTVDADWNPQFHQLLQAFCGHTGISVLINTSFNKKGMPIVETPLEAIDFFMTCALDALVIGNYILQKNEAGSNTPD